MRLLRQHCAELAALGKKEHLITLGTCNDCASICSTAARIVFAVGRFGNDLRCLRQSLRYLARRVKSSPPTTT